MTIKYEDPKDNPNRENLLTNYIDYLLNIGLIDIESKSCYEAYFYIGKLCSLGPTQKEFKIFLEKKNVFIQALKALYEKVETIDFKESIFVYILYSINILNFFIPSNDKVIFFVFVGNIGYSNSCPLPYRDHSVNVPSLDVLFLLPFTGQSP